MMFLVHVIPLFSLLLSVKMRHDTVYQNWKQQWALTMDSKWEQWKSFFFFNIPERLLLWIITKYIVKCGGPTYWDECNSLVPLNPPDFPRSLSNHSFLFLHLSLMPVSLDTVSSLLSLQVDKVIDQVEAFMSVSSCGVHVKMSTISSLETSWMFERFSLKRKSRRLY